MVLSCQIWALVLVAASGVLAFQTDDDGIQTLSDSAGTLVSLLHSPTDHLNPDNQVMPIYSAKAAEERLTNGEAAGKSGSNYIRSH